MSLDEVCRRSSSFTGPILRMCRLRLMPQITGSAIPFTFFLMHFDPLKFEDGHFSQFDIAFPAHIAGAVRKRKAEFLCGRLCARAALRDLGIAAAGEVAVGTMREPLWPNHVVGSITHSDTIAAAAAAPLTRWRSIGIDIEALADATALEAMRASALSVSEWAYLRRFEASIELRVLVTLVFSAKESFYKAVFGVVKRFFDFDALELADIDWAAQKMSFKITQPLSSWWQPGDNCQIGFELLDEGHVFTAFAW